MAKPQMNQPQFGETVPNTEPTQNNEFPWASLTGRYPEPLPPDSEEHVPLRVVDTNLILKKENVTLLSGEEFALIRRDGFGGSDSSVLLGVNPFTSKRELFDQKARTNISEEEAAIGEQTAVMKGNDLEPLIIRKFAKTFNLNVLKPTDMYIFKEYPYLTMNFDGIIDAGDRYFPAEIKVVTKKGEKHYDPTKAIYTDGYGLRPLPTNYSETNNSWETKAALYGIPPYYYTQLQQEMFAVDAPFGFLATLWEYSWQLIVYFVWADKACQNALVIEGFKGWEYVKKLRAERGLPEYFTQ